MTGQPICYQAKNNRYATFRIPHKGTIQSVTLIHISGNLKCNTAPNPTNWGCSSAAEPHDILVSITDDQDTVIFPKEDMDDYGFTTIPGVVDLTSQELTLEPSSPYIVQEPNQEMRVWYNQDLIDGTEGNNSGEQCIEVVINYD